MQLGFHGSVYQEATKSRVGMERPVWASADGRMQLHC